MTNNLDNKGSNSVSKDKEKKNIKKNNFKTNALNKNNLNKNEKITKSNKSNNSANNKNVSKKSEITTETSLKKLTEFDILKKKTFDFFASLKASFSKLFEKEKEEKYISEFYELDNRYDETTVKVIAQTPKKLFVYWDVSDVQKKQLAKEFGDDFFKSTYPVLIVENNSTGESFEITVNDFTNSWYIDIPDNSSDYSVQYARRNFEKLNISHSYPEKISDTNLQFNSILNKKDKSDFSFSDSGKNFVNENTIFIIGKSNHIHSPNGHVLNISDTVTFKNINTGNTRTLNSNEYVKTISNIYGYYDEYVKNTQNKDEKLSSY